MGQKPVSNTTITQGPESPSPTFPRWPDGAPHIKKKEVKIQKEVDEKDLKKAPNKTGTPAKPILKNKPSTAQPRTTDHKMTTRSKSFRDVLNTGTNDF